MFVTSQTVRRKQIFTEITCVNFELSVKTAWYTIAPLVAIALLIVFSAFYQQPTPKQIEVLPWIVGLFFIGMPHGAADLAVLQSKKSGWRLFNTFLWYVVSMIGVLIAFILTPTISLVGFLFLSLWHFGSSENPTKPVEHGISYEHLLMSFAKGGIVIGTPLAFWPTATSGVATELITLVEPARSLLGMPLLVHPIYQSSHIATTGIVLLAIALCCWCFIFFHCAWNTKMLGMQKMLENCGVFITYVLVGILEIVSSPLFGIGIYFLAFHSWKQMPSISKHLASPSAEIHPVRQALIVHKAAMPLLIPTWILLGGTWWWLSDTANFRDLALLSLLVYLIVTPAHEVLCEWLSAEPETA